MRRLNSARDLFCRLSLANAQLRTDEQSCGSCLVYMVNTGRLIGRLPCPTHTFLAPHTHMAVAGFKAEQFSTDSIAMMVRVLRCAFQTKPGSCSCNVSECAKSLEMPPRDIYVHTQRQIQYAHRHTYTHTHTHTITKRYHCMRTYICPGFAKELSHDR